MTNNLIPGFVIESKDPNRSYWETQLKFFQDLLKKAKTPWQIEHYKQEIKRVETNIKNLDEKQVKRG